MRRFSFPRNKRFAFTVFDDTDNGTVANLSPVYELLFRHGIKTTKSVWVYPPRGPYKGESLANVEYREFILRLRNAGFEIALHNVGDGEYSRKEILEGLEEYFRVIGNYPKVHTNHSSNLDNLYWAHERLIWPLNLLYRIKNLTPHVRGRPSSGGSDPRSSFFWGDAAKRHIKYIRNFTFNDINVLRNDPMTPYLERAKLPYSNYWFSSSDGHNVEDMNSLLSDVNLDRLETEHGICIVYTHFADGYVDSAGNVNAEFSSRIAELSKREGWFVPVGELLDYLVAAREQPFFADYSYLLKLNLRWAFGRVIKLARTGR